MRSIPFKPDCIVLPRFVFSSSNNLYNSSEPFLPSTIRVIPDQWGQSISRTPAYAPSDGSWTTDWVRNNTALDLLAMLYIVQTP
ncbi:hypothetical protein ACHAWU_007905 [Discostella pseudostelligera]|uniref:Uncharacterized protein n=1 Tax=Discostella pseudostelligera TaxID=259834 RepID=A0ABD3MA27_9STRA